MRKFILTPLIAILLSIGLTFNSTAQDLMITGVFDGPLTGGSPKVLELYAVNDIADMSVYTVKNQTNANTTWGNDFALSGSAVAGDFVYVVYNANAGDFNTYFENTITALESSVVNLNGDDRLGLFDGTDALVDIYGAVDTDGTGTAWEWLDGWAYRNAGATAAADFIEADWTFSGIDVTDGETLNSTAATPFPIGTFIMGGGTLGLPFYETFETWPLENWTVEGTTSIVWESNNGASHGPGTGNIPEGTLAAMFNVYDATRGDTTTMTSAIIDMDGATNPTLEFQFWMEGSSDVDLWLKAEMSTDGSTWTEVFYQQQDGNISDWTDASVVLTGANATTQIRLIGSSDYGIYNLFVDDLSIMDITCPAVSDFAVGTINANDVQLSWTENGSATAWNIIYGAPGFDPASEGTTVAADAIPFTVTGLTPETDYEFYVQADCGAGDLSTLVGPVSATTPPTCLAPTALTVDNTTAFDVTLSWTENGSATAWNIIYGADGFDPTTEGTTVAADAIPFTVTSLTPETDYDFYVQANCAIDDQSANNGPVSALTLPTCLAPTDLTVNTFTSSEATISWVEEGTTTSWNLIFGVTGFDPSTEGTTVPVSGSSSYTISGLTSNTDYDVYVEADCGAGDISAQVGPESFTTLCDVFSTLPFNETFNSDSPNEACWLVINENGDSDEWDLNYTYNTYEGDQVAVLYTDYNSGNNNDYLVTPGIVLTGNEILSYQYRTQSSSETDEFEVLLSTSGTAITDFTEILVPTTVYSNTSYEMETVDLSAYSGTVYIAWHVPTTTVDGWRVYIDDVTIREVSDENAITAFTHASLTGDATIDASAFTVTAEAAMGTSLTDFAPSIEVSPFATISPESNVAQDFSTGAVTYTVTSESGIAQPWNITVTEATSLSSENDIISFEIPEATSTVINPGTIDITVGWLTDVTSLIPTISVSPLATISPESGVAQDFTSPVTYTVTAEDGTTQDYVITVTMETAPLGANCSNPYLVTLPADLAPTYEHLAQTTCGMGNIYDNLDIPSSTYDDGEDVIYEITVTADTYVKMTLDPKTTSYTAIAIFDACPDAGTLIEGDYGYTAGIKTFEVGLTVGTYYVIIDRSSWGGACITEYDFTIETVCPAPYGIEETNLTATSADIIWTPEGFETGWNIKVNSGSAIADPSTTDGDIVANEAVSTTPLYTIIDGTLTAETDYYVYIQADCGSDWVEYMFTTPSSCSQPTDVFANPASDMAEISWTSYGMTEWNIKVSTTSIDPTSADGDIVANETTTNNPYSLLGLSENTEYFVYVQASCSSDWSTEYSFTTPCLAFNIPYTEDFEAFTLTEGFSFENCWTGIGAGANDIDVVNDSGLDMGAPNSGSVAIELNDGEFNTDLSAFVSPELLGLTAGDKQIKFYAIAEDITNELYIATIENSLDPATLTYVDTIEFNATSTWEEYTIILNDPSILGSGTHIAFVHDNTLYEVGLDDFVYEEIPTCLTPTNLFADAITATSANLNWTGNGETTWNIKVSSTSIDPATVDGDILPLTSTMDNPYTSLSGLTSNTTYYFYVQADCGAGDTSEWSNEGIFSTECILYSLPFEEDFTGVTATELPECWNESHTHWDVEETTYAGGTSPELVLNWNPSTTDEIKAFLPSIDATLNSNIGMTFLHQCDWYENSFDIRIDYTIDGGATWNTAWSQTAVSADIDAQEVYIDMSSMVDGEVFQLAFIYNGNTFDINDWNVDNIRIFEVSEITDIDINTDVADINVCQNTVEADAIADLVSQITITDVNAAEYIVDLTWTIASYDETTPGDYVATGTFELPLGVVQTDPATLLEVSATITVDAAVDPTFSFATVYDVDATADALPTTSDNGIEGTWAPETIATDVAGTADYVFTPNAGICANPVTITVTVNSIVPQIATIDTNNDVEDINVCLGDDEATAIAGLVTEITITDTDAADHIVALTWTIDSYDGNTAGTYNATGTFELPAGVDQTDPATTLEVTAIVTVNELPVVTCPATITLEQGSDPITLTGATPEGGEYTGTNVTDGVFDPSGLTTGTHTMTYTYTDPATGCENFCEFDIEITVGIPTVCIETIEVYPNPTSGMFNIDMTLVENQDVAISIVNTNGQVVREMKFDDINKLSQEIDMSDVAEGLYNIRINAGGEMINHQIIIR